MAIRKLTKNEIAALSNQGCSSTNWQNVNVTEEFVTDNIWNVRFEGEVDLGLYSGKIEVEDNISKPCGLYNSYIQDCTIEDNVLISNVGSLVNYEVKQKSVLENIGTLAVTGESTFGNGVEIDVFNEGGGRELKLYENLTAQVAYFTVTYRHDKKIIDGLNKLIDSEVESKKSTKGMIGEGAKITNSTQLKNINVGAFAKIAGASYLENGTIVSEKEAPTFVGESVIAKNFIIHKGSKVDSGAILEDTFVGQSVKIGLQFSATHSCFFANCEGFHGEACSIFAGPFTVTHHKSTLLIAGMFSFYNAGSGTNQSNHMYKLGPLHQGILERGSKTGSFSYLLWPSRIGAYTAVIGKHYANFDTTEFPFSYINEEKGNSVLVPAMNLLTVGTRRDSAKWPTRDKRKTDTKLDLINFELFNPYIINKVKDGISILSELYQNASREDEFVTYKGISIKRLLLRTSRKYYNMALKIFMGEQLVKQMDAIENISSLEMVKEKLTPQSEVYKNWIDASGFIAPTDLINAALKDVANGKLSSIDELTEKFNTIFAQSDNNIWAYTVALIESSLDVKWQDMTSEHFAKIIGDWKTSMVKLNNIILGDAEKEFPKQDQLAYGIDLNDDEKIKDFEAVRGTYDENSFVVQIRNESDSLENKVNELLNALK